MLCVQHITDMNVKLELVESKTGTGSSRHSAAHYHNLTDTLRKRLLQTTGSFKQILTLRTESLKSQDRRRNLYSSCVEGSNEDQKTFSFTASGQSFDVEGQQHQQRTIRYNQQRADGVEQVQRMIGELGQIFHKVASMVTQQEELVQRIDEDIDTTITNVNQGQSELLSYFQRISSDRALILKVFAVIIAFVIFFVLFLT
eukprot:GHVQ01036140.1.p1 GENE.GHVQ01036140.1~~GHVQ01036140.1.p1  ORF type:complete len:200 (+),score=23.89 GHVQ01036140.1:68-667(+)